jgi:hypothetical protein
MAAKRAPGGGRRSQGRFSGLSGTPVNLRMPTNLRNQLVAAAAKSGNSLTQEVLDRLEWTFEEDAKVDRDGAKYSLMFLLGRVIDNAKITLLQPDWRSDPTAWEVVYLAFGLIVKLLKPPGEPEAPSSEKVKRFGNTPKEIAAFIGNMILLEYWNRIEPPSPTNLKDHATQSSMNVARRNLAGDEKGMELARQKLALDKEEPGQ